MPTSTDFTNVLAQHLYIPYNSSGTRDLNPNDGWSSTDCSGFMVDGMRAIGIEPPAFNSTGLEIWCRGAQRSIPVEEAINTNGALLFVWGTGAEGHVACSTGDGGTLETPAWNGYGHASGRGKARGRGWTGGGLIPGMTYGVDWAAIKAYADAVQAAKVKAALQALALAQRTKNYIEEEEGY